MTRRRSWTARRRLALFEAHKGTCHICGQQIDGTREVWEVEHIIPIAMGGEDDEANAAPAHQLCHKSKTKADVSQIAKANRVRAKHNGASAPSKCALPASRKSKWKKKLDGTVELRSDA